MYNKNTTLASLLSSRICHDLANPLGAISNGLELMELSGAPMTPEFELTAASVQNAHAKLSFFRIAFGPTNGLDMSSSKISKVLADVYLHTRCRVRWKVIQTTSRADAKLLFLMVQCLESALPRGGEISVMQDDQGILISANGLRLNCDNANWDHLMGHQENADLSASDVHFELARIALAEAGKTLQLSMTADQVVIRI